MRWIIGLIIVAALVAGVLSVIPAQSIASHPYFTALPDRPLVIAHRGGVGLRPGNTLWAFHAAEAMGADVLEADIHQTADGVLVVIHDDTLDRTTDRTGAVAALTLADIRAADAGARFTMAGGPSYAGLGIRVPTLEEVIAAHPEMPLVLEIKPDDGETARALCTELRDRGAAMRTLVGSFHDEAIKAFRAACPEIATSMASGEIQTFYALAHIGLSRFYPTKAVALQIPEEAGGVQVANRRLMDAAHARGFQVQIWTVNESADMERLLDLGADGIITDRVDRLTAVLRDRAARASSCVLTAPTLDAVSESCRDDWIDHTVGMNQIQAIGTHNSYKLAIDPVEMALIRAQSPELADSIDYSHRALTWQLDEGARQLELDLFHDPEGGRFADPLGPRIAASQGLETLPFDTADLMAPGFKVFHTQDIDYRSSCLTFIGCLEEIRGWSQANPAHVPLLILLNLKDAAIPLPGSTDALPFDAEAFAAMDAEIRSVFGLDRLITPDEVRGGYPTLRDAVRAGGWPRLGEARGRVMFALDTGTDNAETYRAGYPALETRAVFINIGKDSPAAAYRTMNDPIAQGEAIRAMVREGYLVRTRADADTVEARTNDTARQTAAFASGAQYVSTDYLEPDIRLSAYTASLPGRGVGRCNPVSAPACGLAQVE